MRARLIGLGLAVLGAALICAGLSQGQEMGVFQRRSSSAWNASASDDGAAARTGRGGKAAHCPGAGGGSLQRQYRRLFQGTIYRGNSKKFCVPGLNCYSCPGAIASCPLGALQASLNNFPTAVPLYLLGILLLFGALLGRAVCAFLCPFGLIQELLYKIPTKKLKKSAWTRRLTVIKYIVLVVMVIALPLYFLIVNGVVTPAFCKWLCPAGTLEGGVPLVIANEGLRAQLGWLCSWKALVTVAVVVASIFIYRPFCRFLCPLGAIYSLFNRTAVFGVRLDKKKCTHCGPARAPVRWTCASSTTANACAVESASPVPDGGHLLQIHRTQRRKDP